MKRKISISLFFVGLTICLCMGIIIGSSMGKSKVTVQKKNEQKEFSLIKKPENVIIHEEARPVSVNEEITNADTTYMILEKNMNTGNISTNLTTIPENLIGLNREQLLDKLADIEANPPLIELEKGFISLELVAFSPEQIEIQMNYKEVKPNGIYYIMVYDHKLMVMLEDKKTVFLATEIPVSVLPQEVQQDVTRGLFIPNELSLYDFLENYTS